MTVVDASALITAFTGDDERSINVEQALVTDALAAPGAVRAEFASALRGQEWAGQIDGDAAVHALEWCLALPITLHPVEPLLARIWELRHNVTPYDAWYVALAEALDAPLLTTDTRLARAPGIHCEVRVV